MAQESKKAEAMKQAAEEMLQKEKERLNGFRKVFEGMRLHKGHTLWAINMETLEINPAEYTVIDKKNPRKQVVKDPNCFYIGALNKKNAINKLIRVGIIRKKGDKFTETVKGE